MNITKPKKINLNTTKLNSEKSSNLINYYKNNLINYSIFENEENFKISHNEFEFNYCKFKNINMQNEKSTKLTFKDVIFDNCNFSNTSFSEDVYKRQIIMKIH